MGFVKIFWKNNTQDAYLPNISIVAQIVSDILPPVMLWWLHTNPPKFGLGLTFRPKSYRPKNRTKSLIRDQKSNKHIAVGYKKLFRAFVREAVQFLVPKKPLP